MAIRENVQSTAVTDKPSSPQELFTALRNACKEQFGFNPELVSKRMRYLGRCGPGVYRFEDTGTHSAIKLEWPSRKALLIRRKGCKKFWSAEEVAAYRMSDELLKER